MWTAKLAIKYVRLLVLCFYTHKYFLQVEAYIISLTDPHHQHQELEDSSYLEEDVFRAKL